MGSPAFGGQVSITSSVAGSKIKHLYETATKVQSVSFSIPDTEVDITGAGDGGIMAYTGGLKEGEFNITSLYPRTRPRIGNSGGIVTWSGGPTYKVRSYSLALEFGGVDEITAPAGSAVQWKTFGMKPGYSWAVTFECLWDRSAAFEVPPDANSSSVAATFKLAEDGTDPTFSGNVVLVGGPQVVASTKDFIIRRYTARGDGAITFAAGSTLPALLPAGSLTASVADWDSDGDGTPDITTVVTLDTSRTITAPMALQSLNFGWSPDKRMEVQSVLKIMDTATFA